MKKLNNRNDLAWYFLGFAWILSMVFGIIGFAKYSETHSLGYSFWDNLYLTFQLIPLNSGGLEPPVPFLLNIARFLSPTLAGLAAIKALWVLFRQQIQSSRMSMLHNHIIICGLSHKGWIMANQFRSEKKPVVIIERNKSNQFLEGCQKSGMFIMIGDATDPDILEKAGITHANGLFAVCEDDGINVEIALKAQAQIQIGRPNPLLCLVHVSDPQLCQILNKKMASLEKNSFQLEMFNVYERGARSLLIKFPAWNENELTSPQILILGLGRFGQNLLLQIGRNWWNFQNKNGQKLKTIVIDRKAQQNTALLLARYPQLKTTLDIIPINMELDSAEFEMAEFIKIHQPDRIYICLDNDSNALKAGLFLQQRSNSRIPIIIRMLESGGLERLIHQPIIQMHETNLIPFLVLEEVCNTNLINEQPRDILAKSLHENYIENRISGGSSSNNDQSMVAWEDLDSIYKNKNYQQVDNLLMLTSDFGFQITPLIDWDAPSYNFASEIVDQMAEKEHELWMADCTKEGWMYQPGEKDLRTKTNPALINWNDLPDQERQKNRDYVRNIPKLLAKAGYQLSQK